MKHNSSFIFMLTITIKDVEEKDEHKVNAFKSLIKCANNAGTGAIFGGLVTLTTGGLFWPIKLCAYITSYIWAEMVAEKTDSYIDDHIVVEKAEVEEG